jgi:hypothetical protein
MLRNRHKEAAKKGDLSSVPEQYHEQVKHLVPAKEEAPKPKPIKPVEEESKDAPHVSVR